MNNTMKHYHHGNAVNNNSNNNKNHSKTETTKIKNFLYDFCSIQYSFVVFFFFFALLFGSILVEQHLAYRSVFVRFYFDSFLLSPFIFLIQAYLYLFRIFLKGVLCASSVLYICVWCDIVLRHSCNITGTVGKKAHRR